LTSGGLSLAAGKVRSFVNRYPANCVILADRHHGLTEGVRGLLGSAFDAVIMVADEPSLLESTERIQPSAVVVDLSLVRGESLEWLRRLRSRCPNMKLIVISVHDEPSVEAAVLAVGADAFVLKRSLATDLLAAIDAVLAGELFFPKRTGRPPAAKDPA
jgi:DNA-binding NarL/FixJ family response regulator